MKKLALMCLALITLASCGIESGEGVAKSDGVNSDEHRIFVSSSTTNGNMGGLSGADQICANLASAAGLVRTYKAVLSDDTSEANDRLVFTGPIYTVSGNGSITNLVAASGTEFWNSSSVNFTNSIELDEDGGNVGNVAVWTGTNSDGGNEPDNCSNWTSTGGSGSLGQTSVTDFTWVENPPSAACSGTYRIYCVSQ